MAAERPFGSEVGGLERHLNPDALPAGESFRDLTVERSFDDVRDQRRILEMLARLGGRREEKKKLPSKNVNTSNGWEPFNTDLDPTNQKFINLYGGVFSQQMELLRPKVEELLRVAAIDGKVVLTTMSADRKRSISGVTSEGAVMARRGLFWGEKIVREYEQPKPYQVL